MAINKQEKAFCILPMICLTWFDGWSLVIAWLGWWTEIEIKLYLVRCNHKLAVVLRPLDAVLLHNVNV